MYKSKSQQSIFYKGLKLFNELPNVIKNVETLGVFKQRLCQYVKENDLN